MDTDWYYMILSNCAVADGSSWTGNVIDGQVSLIMQSQPGEYLSLSKSPLQILFIVASVLWGLFFLAWALPSVPPPALEHSPAAGDVGGPSVEGLAGGALHPAVPLHVGHRLCVDSAVSAASIQ